MFTLSFVNWIKTYIAGWESNDPRWIGAWWLGALILAALMALFSLVLGSFPRVMNKQETKSEDNTSSRFDTEMTTSSTVTLESRHVQTTNKAEVSEGMLVLSSSQSKLPVSKNLMKTTKFPCKEFKKASLRLIRNPVLLCSCGSSIFTILGLAGYFIWLPKYFEHEFRLSKSTAAMYSG